MIADTMATWSTGTATDPNAWTRPSDSSTLLTVQRHVSTEEGIGFTAAASQNCRQPPNAGRASTNIHYRLGMRRMPRSNAAGRCESAIDSGSAVRRGESGLSSLQKSRACATFRAPSSGQVADMRHEDDIRYVCACACSRNYRR
jgi:hypothetical protein